MQFNHILYILLAKNEQQENSRYFNTYLKASCQTFTAHWENSRSPIEEN